MRELEKKRLAAKEKERLDAVEEVHLFPLALPP
jgi:hypothetical protein